MWPPVLNHFVSTQHPARVHSVITNLLQLEAIGSHKGPRIRKERVWEVLAEVRNSISHVDN